MRTYIHIHTHTCVRIYTYIPYAQTCIYIRTSMRIYKRAGIYAYMHANKHSIETRFEKGQEYYRIKQNIVKKHSCGSRVFCYNSRASYAQCKIACRCLGRQVASPLGQFFRTCAICRPMAFHRRICFLSSSGIRRPI
ncbi:MAG: hypothetical protein UX49_C0051G0004 [Candidatus Wolfebacteria bacterium GW2011_GWC2_46_275]|uniref:Uncharacterized protein n=1 Tax=Candidatus Wolfebacteria bacterium GW2011_GWB1_47_1 TaxID=1619007 RepID=A0A0G4ARZ7_9BACT|nr:MAG: hypothetical protein UX70_C0001G0589 [Candidatus Wolfebacteria bacterium GW2011_GWB1_47_1]KKU34198.1 MAG: hypothetical protein UX49_C0051G0004 [Candidatus Wolfebacteria bacterium GW2011_GWC2_46_275]KKU70533.1 MAG: hypothetical protein UX96_C0042G0006 [Candidatus Wolfebacteria bacterium GW2011_GWB1_47_243]